MKKIKIFFTAWLLGSVGWAQAQTPQAEAAPVLEAAPAALSAPAPVAATESQAPALFSRKPQFSLNMGSQFSRFGQAAFLQPTVALPVTQRFQAFASVRFLSTMGAGFYRPRYEAGLLGASARQQQSYLVMAGGNYALNEKLNITGSIWRDFSQAQPYQPGPIHLFAPGGSQGMSLRAHYKINDRFSVSGGLRYGNGRGYPGYHQSFYQDYNAPFGF